MKTSTPTKQTFTPELSHTLAALQFLKERTQPIFDKAAKPSLPLPKAWTMPCATCGKETGYPWSDCPQGPMIWCINSKCEDFHTTFTQEEWQARGLAGKEARENAHDADY